MFFVKDRSIQRPDESDVSVLYYNSCDLHYKQNEYFAETVLLIRNKKQNVKLILILDIACPKSNSFLYIVLNENKLKRISIEEKKVSHFGVSKLIKIQIKTVMRIQRTT